MDRVFIVGAIGFNKMAAECLLIQMIHKIRKESPGTHIGVLSHEPGQTAKLGVEAVPQDDMKAMWEAVADSNTVVWLRSEQTLDWRTLGLEVLLMRLAKWQKKQTYGYRSQQCELQAGWLGQRAESTFNSCGRKVLFSIDADEPCDHSSQSHPLLSVRRSHTAGLRHLQDEGIHLVERPLAICLDRQTAMSQADRIAALADGLIDAGAALLFMPVDHFPDMEAANYVLERMNHAAPVMRKAYAAQEWIDILGDTQTVLTTYESVRAMCHGLDVPCVELHEQTLTSVPTEELLEEVANVATR